MSMSKRLLSAALIAGLGAAATPATQAGTITINGRIMSQTCTVNAGNGADGTVTLPLVNVSNFVADGDTAGATNFSIALTNCETQLSTLSAAAKFDAGGNVDATTGNLTTTGGTNIQIRVTDSTGNTPINFNGADATAQHSPTVDIHTGSGTLSYKAMYYKSGTVNAGDVHATVNYTIAYL